MNNCKLKPILRQFSSPLDTLNLSTIQIAIQPKKTSPEVKKDVTKIYVKTSHKSNELF